jgi:hypothetical protein
LEKTLISLRRVGKGLKGRRDNCTKNMSDKVLIIKGEKGEYI